MEVETISMTLVFSLTFSNCITNSMSNGLDIKLDILDLKKKSKSTLKNCDGTQLKFNTPLIKTQIQNYL